MIFIQGARVIDPASETDGVLDLVIDQGKIIAMEPKIDPELLTQKVPAGELITIRAEGLAVAPGLIDVHVHFRDPGMTYR